MLTRTIVPVLGMLSAPVLAQTTDFDVQSFMPLAVGNSWTYDHFWEDYRYGRDETPPSYTDWEMNPELTIEVLRTEVIGGETYYVLSDMPSTGWPPAPTHFIAGKKLRWDGDNLVEHNGTSIDSLYRFHTPPTTVGWVDRTYTIANGQTAYSRIDSAQNGVARMFFSFVANSGDTDGSGALFMQGYGISRAGEETRVEDYFTYENKLGAKRAVLLTGSDQRAAEGRSDAGEFRQFNFEDVLWAYYGSDTFPEGTPVDKTSGVTNSSWGDLKDDASK